MNIRYNIPILRLSFSTEDIEEIKQEIAKVMESGYLTMGERVYEFEKEFARFCGTSYALGTNSGTSSLEIILRAIDVSGGTVVMPSNTYMATPLAAIKAGASVIFTECQVENFQMDPDDLMKKIRPDTRAVVIVHIGGIISPYIGDIQYICKRNDIPLIEDAAHAHGATFKGKIAGQFGVAASFSFYPTKVLTTAEGGMLVTNDQALYKKGIILREHGKVDNNFNIHTEIGDNWRLSELHAVLGLQQMKKVHQILGERRRLAALYDSLLKEVGWLKLLKIPNEVQSSYYKYIVFLPNHTERGVVKNELKEQFSINLPGEVYSNPCHNQPLFKKYPKLISNDKKDEFPVTEYLCKHHICLPLYPGLKDEEVEYVVKSLKLFYQKFVDRSDKLGFRK